MRRRVHTTLICITHHSDDSKKNSSKKCSIDQMEQIEISTIFLDVAHKGLAVPFLKKRDVRKNVLVKFRTKNNK
jgi:hypothetical protein